jgi:hypothetical protein
MQLKLKVVPGASRSEISGWLGDTLKLRVAAPPEKGKANKAVEALLCEALGHSAGAVRIVSGHGSPRKTAEIEGLSTEDVRRCLDRILKENERDSTL